MTTINRALRARGCSARQASLEAGSPELIRNIRRGRIQPATARPDVGDVRCPLAVLGIGGEVALQHVGCHRVVMVRVGGHPVAAPALGAKALLAHQTRYAVPSDCHPVLDQVPVHPRAAVGPTRRRVARLDVDQQAGGPRLLACSHDAHARRRSPLRETSSSRHIMVTGNLAFSASMNANLTSIPWRRRPTLFLRCRAPSVAAGSPSAAGAAPRARPCSRPRARRRPRRTGAPSCEPPIPSSPDHARPRRPSAAPP